MTAPAWLVERATADAVEPRTAWIRGDMLRFTFGALRLAKTIEDPAARPSPRRYRRRDGELDTFGEAAKTWLGPLPRKPPK